jgi:hypothetical protein
MKSGVILQLDGVQRKLDPNTQHPGDFVDPKGRLMPSDNCPQCLSATRDSSKQLELICPWFCADSTCIPFPYIPRILPHFLQLCGPQNQELHSRERDCGFCSVPAASQCLRKKYLRLDEHTLRGTSGVWGRF